MKQKTKRQVIEEKFHDEYAQQVNVNDISIRENFSIAAQENRKAKEIFGELKGKKILDLGCGFGETAVFWALNGAAVEAVDISSKSIDVAKKLAQKNRVSKVCHFQQMAAENLKFPNNYFDFVFGNGVLHHVDIQKSSQAIKRVLKKGGKAAFVEPLSYNPVIGVYRMIADKVRTPTERPLSFQDIEKISKYFQTVKHHEFQLSTLLIFIWFFIVSQVNPNKERYWRKILQVKGNLKNILKVLISLDKIILRTFPPLKYLCWNTVIEIKK